MVIQLRSRLVSWANLRMLASFRRWSLRKSEEPTILEAPVEPPDCSQVFNHLLTPPSLELPCMYGRYTGRSPWASSQTCSCYPLTTSVPSSVFLSPQSSACILTLMTFQTPCLIPVILKSGDAWYLPNVTTLGYGPHWHSQAPDLDSISHPCAFLSLLPWACASSSVRCLVEWPPPFS